MAYVQYVYNMLSLTLATASFENSVRSLSSDLAWSSDRMFRGIEYLLTSAGLSRVRSFVIHSSLLNCGRIDRSPSSRESKASIIAYTSCWNKMLPNSEKAVFNMFSSIQWVIAEAKDDKSYDTNT